MTKQFVPFFVEHLPYKNPMHALEHATIEILQGCSLMLPVCGVKRVSDQKLIEAAKEGFPPILRALHALYGVFRQVRGEISEDDPIPYEIARIDLQKSVNALCAPLMQWASFERFNMTSPLLDELADGFEEIIATCHEEYAEDEEDEEDEEDDEEDEEDDDPEQLDCSLDDAYRDMAWANYWNTEGYEPNEQELASVVNCIDFEELDCHYESLKLVLSNLEVQHGVVFQIARRQ